MAYGGADAGGRDRGRLQRPAAAGDRLAYAVWVEAPAQLRLERGLERDGRDSRPLWDAWMAEEDAHFAQDGTRARCDLVVDGNPGIDHDPETEFVRIG